MDKKLGKPTGKLKAKCPPSKTRKPIEQQAYQGCSQSPYSYRNLTPQEDNKTDKSKVQQLVEFFEAKEKVQLKDIPKEIHKKYFQNRWVEHKNSNDSAGHCFYKVPPDLQSKTHKEVPLLQPKTIHSPRESIQSKHDVNSANLKIKRPARYTRDFINKDENFPNGSINKIVDSSFKKINKNSTSFLIWRVENLNLIAVPKDQYGTFYDHDSYIIYAASQYGHPTGPNEISRELRAMVEYHVHFWLGKYTTADKSGVAAYKTVELDWYLGSAATQHREVQGTESPRFKSYFRDGIRILNGGTETGFHLVQNTFVPKLYQVKGKRAPTLTQMPDISWKYFNSGDVFLLHAKNTVFLWVGQAANPIEKLNAAKAAMLLRTESNASNIVFIDDGYEKTLHDSDKRKFEVFLPLHERTVIPAQDVEDDEVAEWKFRANIRLYQCSDNSGKYRVTEIKTGPLKQEDLCSDDVFILDHGHLGIWVWVGKRATEKERYEAMRNARGFVKKKKYPMSTAVTRVIDGAEPLEFKMLFLNWRNKDETKGLIKPFASNKLSVPKISKFDATTMYERPSLAAQTQLMDDGSGVIKKWRIKRFELLEQPKESHNVFFNTDCYIILYNYVANGQKYIIYYWLGLYSSQDEQGTTALKTIEIDNNLNGCAVQARVVQGHEPAHFLQLFKGKMTVFTGKGTDFDVSGKNLKTPNYCLLQVQGSISYDTKATQVVLKAASLNSNYCFVLRKNSLYYVWCGKNSNGDNREMAKGYAGSNFALLMEGSETFEFWNNIGGKGNYTTGKVYGDASEIMPARLFQCSTAGGNFKAEEIFNFIQTDLVPEDVMLLDAHETIFLWIGNLSTKEEQKLSLRTALEYLKTDPAGRDLNTSIIQIRQGFEPPTFTGFFIVWDDNIWKEHKSYEEIRNEIEKSGNNIINNSAQNGPKGDSEFNKHYKYPLNLLRNPNDKLPGSIDPLRKELHLTYDDFVSLFKMDYKEFVLLPMWKQKELKKNVGLF